MKQKTIFLGTYRFPDKASPWNLTMNTKRNPQLRFLATYVFGSAKTRHYILNTRDWIWNLPCVDAIKAGRQFSRLFMLKALKAVGLFAHGIQEYPQTPSSICWRASLLQPPSQQKSQAETRAPDSREAGKTHYDRSSLAVQREGLVIGERKFRATSSA